MVSGHLILPATKNGNMKELRKLVEKEIDIDHSRIDGECALHVAIKHKQKEALKYLLEQGADTTAMITSTAKTPLLCISAILPDPIGFEMLELLVQYGANVNDQDHEGNSLLFYACLEEDIEVIEFLVDNDADLNLVNTEAESCVHWLCRTNNINMELVEYLVKKGTNNEYSVLMWALTPTTLGKNCLKLVRELIKLEPEKDTFDALKSIFGDDIAERIVNLMCSLNFPWSDTIQNTVYEYFKIQNFDNLPENDDSADGNNVVEYWRERDHENEVYRIKEVLDRQMSILKVRNYDEDYDDDEY